MLYRKTTTAFSAVILGVMALLGATAHAQINLNAAGTRTDPIGTAVFSKETLPRPGAMQTHYTVTAPSTPAASQNLLILQSTLGALVRDSTGRASDGAGGVALRYDLDNLRWAEQVILGEIEILDSDGNPVNTTNAPRRIAIGGSGSQGSNPRCDGRTCMILEIGTGSSTDLTADSVVKLWVWNGGLAVHPDGAGRVRARLYSNLDNALAVGGIADENFLGMRSDTGAKLAVDVKSSVTTKINMGTTPAVADVAADPRFTNFAPAGTRPLGNIQVTLAAHNKADGSGPVTMLSDVMDTENSGVVFTDSTENLGFGTFQLRAGTDCSTATGAGAVSVPAEGANAGRGVAGLAMGTRTLCVSPKRPGTATTGPFQEIPVTMINANVTYAAVPNRQFGPMGMNGPIGSIVRNGATVQISYLTVSDRYNQRIIITNRSGSDAEYELTKFYTEDGTEGTAGEDAMGMVPMESSIVVLTRDAVQFTGSRSRGSATLAVTAPARMISVATTQVNLSDGSTDTINYEVMGAGQ